MATVTQTQSVAAKVNGKASSKSAAQKKREKRKQRKRESSVLSDLSSDTESVISATSIVPALPTDALELSSTIPDSGSMLDSFSIDENDPVFAEFRDIFDKYSVDEESSVTIKPEDDLGKGMVYYSDDDDVPIEEDDEGVKDEKQSLSKKKARKFNRLSVAELKQLVSKPDVVEWTDVSAQDPKLLVHLKSYRNTIPVPSHWSQKRDYLASKRGIEKPPFELPDFLKATGIMEMRETILEKQANQSLKSKMRERVQPKMGKLDVDYQKLHDAFFRHQTRPSVTKYGEVYFEGKEFETNLREKRPGELSNELKDALNIPPGAPPPWLINMQRFGPPPSFPNLKIPGLNSPIPPNAQWGFHPGGWGKPPVDEFNRPLYGDVFGVMQAQPPPAEQVQPDKDLWGELEEVEEEEEEEESEEEEDMEVDGAISIQDGLTTPSGIVTPSGMASSVPSGLETPEYLELRKDMGQRPLYQVLPEQERRRGFLGGAGYDMAGGKGPVLGEEEPSRKRKNGGVDVALDPMRIEGDESGYSTEQLRELHDREVNKQSSSFHEDLSDMVAEEAAKQAKKRAKKEDERKKKYKF